MNDKSIGKSKIQKANEDASAMSHASDVVSNAIESIEACIGGLKLFPHYKDIQDELDSLADQLQVTMENIEAKLTAALQTEEEANRNPQTNKPNASKKQ